MSAGNPDGGAALTFASYNIRKAVGLDRRRDPERIMRVLHEIDADVIALQEADRRFGRRITALPLGLIDESPWRAVPLNTRPDSIGWHGNAMLVRKGLEVLGAEAVPLPTLEPRGAICVELQAGARRLRVVGMHLDLSGIRRRHQIRAILAHLRACPAPCPTVMMGDLNEWSPVGGALREFAGSHEVLAPGRSFHARRPVAQLDRIIISPDISVEQCAVHHSATAAVASDHLPVWARLTP
ncbi:endonuclease [Sphingomonas lacunae]|uniref:Endonuclease n=1 Tax=Sphingomonas lacunae TaxID=2698828 RepID=A0A6M4ATX1_9SPHN|nr:endonuclease/exonuclease/phosphatase family protein [Sphingomonas lacunae]QJQ32176.1 endonuclease [Sphingomonas lacunae]